MQPTSSNNDEIKNLPVQIAHSIDPTDVSKDAKSLAKDLNTNQVNHFYEDTLNAEITENNPQNDNKNIPGATVFSSITNLSNTILGSGMLAMPAAFASVGLFFGAFLVTFSAFASGLGLYFLSQCAQRVNTRNTSFFEVSKITYPSAAKWFDIAIAIKCFGVSISYLIIIGDLMPQVMEYLGFLETSIFLERRFWITVFMLGVIPLAFLKRLDSLKYTSIVALGSVAYLVLIVAFTFLFGKFTIDWEHIIYFKLDLNFLAVLPVFVFGFTCHQNIFSIYNELTDNSSKQVNQVITGSIGAGFFVYQIIGSLGYLSFGNDVKANILSMYPLGPVLTFGRFAVVILALFSYPLQCHPCRACLLKVIGINNTSSKDTSYSSVPTEVESIEEGAVDNTMPAKTKIDENNDDWYFNVITSILIFSGYSIAMLVTKLDVILGFVGSTGSTAISFILPSIFYLKLTKDQPPNVFDDYSTSFFSSLTLRRTLAYCLLCYGFLVMFVCFTFKLTRLFI